MQILALLLTSLLVSACLADDKPALPGKRAETPESTTGISEECIGDALDHPPLKTGTFRSKPQWSPPRPSKGKAVRDPDQGVCIKRLTDHESEPPTGFARNLYSRQQPFNANESLILVRSRKSQWHLYDAETFTHARELDLGGDSVEPQWHPEDPDLLYVIPDRGGLTLMTHNVKTDRRAVVADFTDVRAIAGYPEADDIRDIWPNAARVWTRWEGRPSMDGRYWAFQVETRDEAPLGLIAFDLARQRIAGVLDIRDVGRPDHVSMSPRGNYVVAAWPGKAADCPPLRDRGTLKKPCGVMAFTRDFSEARGLAARSPHSDMAVAASGREVIVISNYDSGNVEMIDLATGDVTPLWRIYTGGASTALHVSGTAFEKPGWVLISTYALNDPRNARPWYENRLIAVELEEDPRVIPLASIINDARTYFSEPHASVNRNFTKVVFNANWGTGKEDDVDVYVAHLSPGALSRSLSRTVRTDSGSQ